LTELRAGRSREQISLKLTEKGTPLGATTLLQYEKGAVWAPDAGVLWGLGQIYGVPLDDLVALLLANRQHPETKGSDWPKLLQQAQAAPRTSVERPIPTFGDNLAHLMRVRKLTPKKLAALCNNAQAVCNIEQRAIVGYRTNSEHPSPRVLLVLARALRCRIEDFFVGMDPTYEASRLRATASELPPASSSAPLALGGTHGSTTLEILAAHLDLSTELADLANHATDRTGGVLRALAHALIHQDEAPAPTVHPDDRIARRSATRIRRGSHAS
jgi:transcriptional regulator with XRE-family HTH domain